MKPKGQYVKEGMGRPYLVTPAGTIPKSDYAKIVKRYSHGGVTYRAIAEEYGVTRERIAQIVRAGGAAIRSKVGKTPGNST